MLGYPYQLARMLMLWTLLLAGAQEAVAVSPERSTALCIVQTLNSLREDAAEKTEVQLTPHYLSFNGELAHVPYVVVPSRNLVVAQFRAGKKNELTIFKLDDGSIQIKVELGRTNWKQLQVSSDGSKLALIGRKDDRSPQRGVMYSLTPEGQGIKEEFEFGLPKAAAFYRLSPDFKSIVSNDYDKDELIVSAVSPTEKKGLLPALFGRGRSDRLPGPSAVLENADINFKTLAFSPDGKSFVVPNRSHSHLLWFDLDHPQSPRDFPTYLKYSGLKVNALAVKPDGGIVTASETNSHRVLLNLIDSNGKFVDEITIEPKPDIFKKLNREEDPRLQVSPDGQTIAVMLNRGLYFYSVKGRRMLRTSHGERIEIVHHDAASGRSTRYTPLDVTFLPDGKKILVHIDGGLFEVVKNSP